MTSFLVDSIYETIWYVLRSSARRLTQSFTKYLLGREKYRTTNNNYSSQRVGTSHIDVSAFSLGSTLQLLLQSCLAESKEVIADPRDELQTYPVSYGRATDQWADDIPPHDAWTWNINRSNFRNAFSFSNESRTGILGTRWDPEQLSRGFCIISNQCNLCRYKRS